MFETQPTRPQAYDKQLLNWLLILIVIFAGLRYSYTISRLGMTIADYDTFLLSKVTFRIDEADSILEATRAYDHGYGYQSFLIFLKEMTGLELHTLQLLVVPLATSLTSLVAFMAIKMITGSAYSAFFATILLYLQPDFIFVTWRGSHESIDWILVLCMIFVLARTVKGDLRIRAAWRYVFLFYILFFGLVSSSTFITTSLVGVILLAFLFGVFIRMARSIIRNVQIRPVNSGQRFFYIGVLSIIIIYVHMFFIYTVTQSSLDAVGSVIGAFLYIIFGVEQSANAYGYVDRTWLNPQGYLLINSITWFILLGGFSSWLVMVWRYFRRSMDDMHFFLMCLYFGFGTVFALAIIFDLGGLFSGNLQVRVIIGIMVVSIIVLSHVGTLFLNFIAPGYRRGIMVAISIALFTFSTLGPLKTTLEPLVNQRWVFISRDELLATEWIVNRSNGSVIWGGMDGRIPTGSRFYNLDWTEDDVLFYGETRTDPNFYMISNLERLRWLRVERPLPQFDNENLVYTNGDSQVYRRLPQTPYQR